MTRALRLATIAISLLAPIATAAAASHQKHHRQHKASAKPVPQPYAFPWAAPVTSQRRGPPGAMPNECFSDEGYGRWMPCVNRP